MVTTKSGTKISKMDTFIRLSYSHKRFFFKIPIYVFINNLKRLIKCSTLLNEKIIKHLTFLTGDKAKILYLYTLIYANQGNN